MNKNMGIGVFDSGVGGLTVANAIYRLLPEEKIIYFGDTAHVPYGDKTEEQIIQYVNNIIDFLLTREIKALVIACNTSSAIALPRLNGKVNIPTLGVIEIASRIALETSINERIGVVANPLTVKNGAYKRTIRNISLNGTMIFQSPCKRWVPLIEAGSVSGEEVEDVVRQDLKPLIDSNIDTLILGCTHYPYLIPTIKKVMNNGIKIIDPAFAMASHLKKILEEKDILSDNKNVIHEFFVSGNPDEFQVMGSRFLGRKIPRVGKVSI